MCFKDGQSDFNAFLPLLLTATTACGAYLPGQLEILYFLQFDQCPPTAEFMYTLVPSRKETKNQMNLPCLPDNALCKKKKKTKKKGKEQNSYI